MTAPPTRPRRTHKAAANLCALFAIFAIALIASRRIPTRANFDQKLYHEPAIRAFAAQWPDINVYDYLSASTPGYHLLMALFARAGAPTFILQCATAALTGALLWLVAYLVEKRTGGWRTALLITLPFACSPYILFGGVYILPDTLGWLLTAAVLAIALRPRVTTLWLLLGGIALLALVLVRQSQAWCAGLLLAAAWLGNSRDALTLNTQLWSRPGARIGRAALALACCVPAILMLGLFACYWGGLVPPRFQQQYPPKAAIDIVLSPAPAYLLAVTGFWGVLFVGYWLDPLLHLWRTKRGLFWGVLAIVLLLAVLPPTTFDFVAGRRSGLWNIAGRLGLDVGRWSLFISGLAILGGLVLTGLLAAQKWRERWILLAAAAGFCAATSVGHEVWQRYVEPMALLLLAVLCAGVEGGVPAPRRALVRAVGPAVLACVLLAIGASSLRDAVKVSDPPPPTRAPDDSGLFTPPCELPPIPTPPGKTFWSCW